MPNAIDFSKLKRLTPREDSWSKVCARLDAAEAKKSNVIHIGFRTAIPLAASLAIVALSILLTYFGSPESNPMPMQNLQSTEISSWYNTLGDTESDDFEDMDEINMLSYLLKEDH